MPAGPHEEPLRVTEADGLCLPEPFIGHDGGLVARMPNGGTIDFQPRKWDGHIPNVRPAHFGDVNEGGRNSYLDADQVGLKKYGEGEQIYQVAVESGGEGS